MHFTGVISSCLLQRMGEGRTAKSEATSVVLCSHLPHTHNIYCRRFPCLISFPPSLYFFNVCFASPMVHPTGALSSFQPHLSFSEVKVNEGKQGTGSTCWEAAGGPGNKRGRLISQQCGLRPSWLNPASLTALHLCLLLPHGAGGF